MYLCSHKRTEITMKVNHTNVIVVLVVLVILGMMT